MKIEITYPKPQKAGRARAVITDILKYIFLVAAFSCAVVNALVGGRAWSVIVIWSVFMAWTLIVSPDMIDYNRISQFIKLIAQSCVLLVLIDVFLTPGWASDVVFIVCFGALIAVCVLLFTDYERQRHNILPMLLLSVISLIVSAVWIFRAENGTSWQVYVTCAVSFAVLIVCLRATGGNIKNDLRKMFYTM